MTALLFWLLPHCSIRHIDLFFSLWQEKDKYGNEIKRLGRPLPVDYLICDMPVAFPLSPSFTFSFPADLQYKFPIENRSATGDIQVSLFAFLSAKLGPSGRSNLEMYEAQLHMRWFLLCRLVSRLLRPMSVNFPAYLENNQTEGWTER